MPELIREFVRYLREERMRLPSTIKNYTRVMDQFVEYLHDVHGDAPLALEAIDKTELLKFMRIVTNGNGEPSRSVWNSKLSALRAFYDFLFKQEYINLNPALRIDRLKLRARQLNPLNLDELIRLTEAIEDHCLKRYRSRNLAIIMVLFHCALRVSEAVSLSLDQLDFDNYMFLDVRTKGDKRLSVGFNDVVAQAIETYLKDRDGLGGGAELPFLFLSDRGKRISVRTVQEMVRHYAELAGISRSVSPHLLRHSSATQLVELGTPLRVVQEICGHASVTTTQRYVHVSGGQRRKALNTLSARWKEMKKRRKHSSGDERLDSA